MIVAFDLEISFPKMVQAMSYINMPGTLFIGTNPDTNWNCGDIVAPLSGNFIQAMEYATKKNAIILGKPNKFLVDFFNKEIHVNPRKTLMIGDR